MTVSNPLVVKRAPSEQPPFTIAQIRAAIPEHCFKRSTLISSLYAVCGHKHHEMSFSLSLARIDVGDDDRCGI
jgi:hypothetical protein